MMQFLKFLKFVKCQLLKDLTLDLIENHRRTYMARVGN
jgi:hypothetical protein